MNDFNLLNQLYDAAERRMNAGEPCKRAYLPPCSYPAGDGPIGCGAWLTAEEAEQVHQIKLAIPANDCAGALARLQAKHAARRAVALQAYFKEISHAA